MRCCHRKVRVWFPGWLRFKAWTEPRNAAGINIQEKAVKLPSMLNNTRICQVLDIDLFIFFGGGGDGKTDKESSTDERGLAFGEN